MKQLDKNELYEHLTGFLKNKGIELKEGTYAQGIQKSCSLLSDAINLGQEGLERAKHGIDKKLDQMRQVIHEKTAPKSSTPPRQSPRPATGSKNSAPKSSTPAKRAPNKPKNRKRKG